MFVSGARIALSAGPFVGFRGGRQMAADWPARNGAARPDYQLRRTGTQRKAPGHKPQTQRRGPRPAAALSSKLGTATLLWRGVQILLNTGGRRDYRSLRK